jgi:hypothetical protein
MKIRKHWRSVVITLAFILGALWFAAPKAFAAGYQWCQEPGDGYAYCLNAWGGGPEVNTYVTTNTANDPTNNDFQYYRTPQGHYELEFVGGGGDTGLCIGDLGNNQYSARAGLVECPTSGAGGWGTQITLAAGGGCPSGTEALYDIHWGAYIATGTSWGGAVYLNSGYKCYDVFYT